MKAKKILLPVLLLCALLAAMFSFAACAPEEVKELDTPVTVKFVLLDTDGSKAYETELTTVKPTLYEAFNEFKELQVQATSSAIGAYINSVSVGKIETNDYGEYFAETKKLAENPTGNIFFAVYHNIDKTELKDLLGNAPNLTYLEKEYFYSGVGVSKLPLEDGAEYIIKLTDYNA